MLKHQVFGEMQLPRPRVVRMREEHLADPCRWWPRRLCAGAKPSSVGSGATRVTRVCRGPAKVAWMDHSEDWMPIRDPCCPSTLRDGRRQSILPAAALQSRALVPPAILVQWLGCRVSVHGLYIEGVLPLSKCRSPFPDIYIILLSSSLSLSGFLVSGFLFSVCLSLFPPWICSLTSALDIFSGRISTFSVFNYLPSIYRYNSRASLPFTASHTTANMRASMLVASALGASVFAAPATPSLSPDASTPGGSQAVADYFNLLATKVQESKSMAAAPVCDLSKAQMSTGMCHATTARKGHRGPNSQV